MTEMIESYMFLDEENDLYIPVYRHKNGGLCRYAIIKDPMFKQGAAYISMLADLRDCLESIAYLITINNNKGIPQIVKTSLLFASIVKYAKCFTTGSGRGTSLNFSEVFKGKRANYLDFHNKTMELRNKYLAHSGNSGHETGAMLAILSPDMDNKKVEDLKYGGLRLKDDDSNIKNYEALYSEVQTHIRERIEKLRILMNDKLAQMDVAELYSDSILPDPSQLVPFNFKFIE